MATRHIAALLALSFTTASLGQQQLPPTDADYHAAYCISLLDEEINFFLKAVTRLDENTKNAQQADFPKVGWIRRQQLAQWRAWIVQLAKARESVSAYFLPRRTSLDLRSRSEANLAAQMDWGDFVMESGRCQEEFPFNPGNQLKAHITSCTNASLIARVQSCRNPTWLPRAL